VAAGNSNLVGVAEKFSKENVVLVYDNEPRNKDLNKLISRAINAGYSVSLFPEAITQKDINEMVLNGYTPFQLAEIIKRNTYSGLKAKLVYSSWKKC
jgi:hypothetical protein